MIDRNREPERFGAAGNFHRINADDLAAAIEQRSAAVAWIDGGVGLQHYRVFRPPDGADDAARDAVLKDAQHKADGDHFLTGADIVDRTEGQYWLRRKRAIHANDGEIVLGRRCLDPAWERVAVGQPDHHGHVVLDDVPIGNDCSRRRKESAPAALTGFDRHDRRKRSPNYIFQG
jgi:hypothetical protein